MAGPIVLLALGPATAADRQVLQANDRDGRDVVLISAEDEAWVRQGQAVSRVDLPPDAWLNRIQPLENGWIAGGARLVEGGQDLLLYGEESGVRWEYQLPPARTGPIRQSAVPLVDNGKLVGIAWLEGTDFSGLAVRAAAFSGADFGASDTVSPPSPGGQVALQGAVLADGSWLLVWSRSDETTTETVWSRHSAESGWTQPQLIHEANDVPDVTPALIATEVGALAAWSWFDGESFRQRMARFRDGQWTDTGYRGPAGSIYPTFLHGAKGPRLLFQNVVPWRWTVVQLDPAGKPLEQARLEEANRERPTITGRGDKVGFWWPSKRPEQLDDAGVGVSAHRELEAAWEPIQ